MGKALALLVAGGGATAISVGGAYLLMRSDSSQQSNPTSEVVSKNVDFADLSAFKTAGGGKCVGDLFEEIENIESLSESSIFNQGNPQGQDFFGTASTDPTKTKGCLIINWEKKESTDKNKWSGIFT